MISGMRPPARDFVEQDRRPEFERGQRIVTAFAGDAPLARNGW